MSPDYQEILQVDKIANAFKASWQQWVDFHFIIDIAQQLTASRDNEYILSGYRWVASWRQSNWIYMLISRYAKDQSLPLYAIVLVA